jgi:hypothetical protein
MAIIRTSARNIQAGDTIVQGVGLPNLTVTKIEVVGSAIAERRKAKGYTNPLKQPPVISRKELRVLRLQLRTSYDCRTLTVREDAMFRIINRIGN